MSSMTSRLPALGPRGEGWVVAQILLFVVIGAAGLLALAANRLTNPWGVAVSAIGLLAIVAGGLLAARGAWDIRASLSPFPRPVPGSSLVVSGAFRLVRHPIYSGLVLSAVGWGLFTASIAALVASALLFLLFAGKSQREEAWLGAEHPEYRAYQKRTKRLIPWVY